MFKDMAEFYNENTGAKANEKKFERVPVPKSIQMTVVLKQKGKCKHCGLDFMKEGIRWEIDHIKPVSKGGKNDEGNLQALCPNCHSKKTLKDYVKTVVKKSTKPTVNEGPSLSGFDPSLFKVPKYKTPKFKFPYG